MIGNTMKYFNNEYHTVGTVSKSNDNSLIETKSIPLKHKYMSAHFPGMV